MKLNELEIGKKAKIISVAGEGQLRNHILDMGLIPGTVVTLVKYAPMGDPMELLVRGYELTLRVDDAKLIGIVGAIIIAALFLKDYIAAGLTWIVTMTLNIIDALIFNIRFQQTDPIYGEDTQIPEGNLFSTERGGKDFLIYILVIVAVILVIVFRKKIISFFKSIAARFFGKFSAEDTDVYEADNYTDSYEKLDIRQERITKTTKKDCLKMYRKEQDKTKKFRLGYRLYLMWLSERSSDNLGNMTVEQQAEKSEKIYHGENDTLQLANRYSEIRYNDKNASDKDFEVADRLIDELYN